MEDADIIRLLLNRDQEGLRQLQARHGPGLLRLAQRILHNPQDAEESVSDTCLAAWNAIPPQQPRHLFAWLCKVCRCAAFDRLDRQQAQKRSAQVVSLSEELACCIPAPAPDWDAQEIGRLLNGFLSGLSPEKRRLFLRRYWFGDSVKEAARRCGLSHGAAKTALFRLREALRDYLEQEGIPL